ncbi:LIM domain-containing protein [Micromonospora sp. NPDC001898]|uniref:LIM domain-containing protein n=1 Tax=Micromonospora sp. NPDC001898 TaxID=3364221 RepID=UPI003690B030
MTTLTCEGCKEPIEDDGSHTDFNGEDWHEACFEVSGGPSYCCGMTYENGEDTCLSCGEPI